VRTAERVTEDIDLGDADLGTQASDDFPGGRVDVATVLLEIPGNPGTGGGRNETRERGGGNGEHVIARTVQCRSQNRNVGGIAVRTGAGDDDSERRRTRLGREPDPQPPS